VLGQKISYLKTNTKRKLTQTNEEKKKKKKHTKKKIKKEKKEKEKTAYWREGRRGYGSIVLYLHIQGARGDEVGETKNISHQVRVKGNVRSKTKVLWTKMNAGRKNFSVLKHGTIITDSLAKQYLSTPARGPRTEKTILQRLGKARLNKGRTGEQAGYSPPGSCLND